MGDRPTGPIKIIRATIRANRIANAFWRTAIFFIGFFLVGVGIVLLVLPGPGWLLIFLGFVTKSFFYRGYESMIFCFRSCFTSIIYRVKTVTANSVLTLQIIFC